MSTRESFAAVGAILVFTAILQTVLSAAAKIAGAVDWPWLAVFAPVILVGALWALVIAAAFVVFVCRGIFPNE